MVKKVPFVLLGIILLFQLGSFPTLLSSFTKDKDIKPKSFSVTQTTQSDFDSGNKINVQVTNIEGGEVKLSSSITIPVVNIIATATFSGNTYLYIGGRDNNHSTIVVRTSDGVNWSLADNGLPGRVVIFNDLKVATFSGTTYLYASVWDETVSPSGNKIYRTSDGVNWSEADNGIPGGLWHQAVLTTATFSGTNYLYAGFRPLIRDNGGVYRTSDGVNWSAVNTGLPVYRGGFGAFSVATFSDTHYLYVAADTFSSSINPPSIYRTSDGATWSLVNAGLPTFYDIRSLAAVTFSGNTYIYVAGLHEGKPSVHRTLNGAVWEAVNDGLPSITYGSIEKGGLAATDFSGTDYLYIGGVDFSNFSPFIYRTSDGVMWEAAENNKPGSYVTGLTEAAFSGTNYLYAGHSLYDGHGSGSGAYRTSDGVNWSDSFIDPYHTEGTFISSIIDVRSIANLSTIAWTEDLPLGTDIVMQTRTSDDGANWSDWSLPLTDASGSTITNMIPNPTSRYVQYKATFSTDNSYLTPVLSDVTIQKIKNNPEAK